MSHRPPANEDQTKSEALLAIPGARRLIVVWPEGSSTHDLPDFGKYLVGRSKECDVRIDHASVSRVHARLHTKPCLAVEDLGSFNGTRVGGHKVAAHAIEPIPGGTIVQLGSAMLVVQEPDASTGHTATEQRSATPATPSAPAGASTVMGSLNRLAEIVAAGTITVILHGETGVGKEVMAERIHRCSPRAGKPFVRISCAAMPEQLLESELFGFERGAFTGATRTKPGLLESANGGSILLDEIGEMSLPTQAKLLRVLENREAQRLGSLQPRKLDVRVLAATHRDLPSLVATGAFRADLYFRLNGMTLTIPPLRERTEEIPALARGFVEQACAQLGRPPVEITRAALDALAAYGWPGNIRELKNVMERAVLLSGGSPIRPNHVQASSLGQRPLSAPAEPTAEAQPQDLRSAVQEFERARVLEALQQSGGNQTRAAKLLGISRRALLDRLDAYDLPRPQKGSRGKGP